MHTGLSLSLKGGQILTLATASMDFTVPVPGGMSRTLKDTPCKVPTIRRPYTHTFTERGAAGAAGGWGGGTQPHSGGDTGDGRTVTRTHATPLDHTPESGCNGTACISVTTGKRNFFLLRPSWVEQTSRPVSPTRGTAKAISWLVGLGGASPGRLGVPAAPPCPKPPPKLPLHPPQHCSAGEPAAKRCTEQMSSTRSCKVSKEGPAAQGLDTRTRPTPCTRV